jgi:predicted DNA-binding transcriptional regulator AlpA
MTVAAPEPRLMSHEQAAAYCNLTLGTFDRWVKTKKLPRAIASTWRWDKRAIDLAIDKLSGVATTAEPVSAWAEWSLSDAKKQLKAL